MAENVVLTTEQKLKLIEERKTVIRQWWEQHWLNPPFKAFMIDNEIPASVRNGLSRWMMMHLRIAAYKDGIHLIDNDDWNEIREQMAYPPLYLVDQMPERAWRTFGTNGLRYYHTVREHGEGWSLVRSKKVTTKFAVSWKNLWRFIGWTGGSKGPNA